MKQFLLEIRIDRGKPRKVLLDAPTMEAAAQQALESVNESFRSCGEITICLRDVGDAPITTAVKAAARKLSTYGAQAVDEDRIRVVDEAYHLLTDAIERDQ